MDPMTDLPDYFALLGIPRNATDEEIRQAFRQKARQTHPDLNPAPDAAERFRELVEAYDILSDKSKRDMYILARLNQKKRTADAPRRIKKPRRLSSILHMNLLFFSFVVLFFVYTRATTIYEFVQAAEETICRIVAWERTADSRYLLTYEAMNIPWQETPQRAQRLFDEQDTAYIPNTYVTCYYNDSLSAIHLLHYDRRDVLITIFWGIVGAGLFIKSLHHFYSL